MNELKLFKKKPEAIKPEVIQNVSETNSSERPEEADSAFGYLSLIMQHEQGNFSLTEEGDFGVEWKATLMKDLKEVAELFSAVPLEETEATRRLDEWRKEHILLVLNKAMGVSESPVLFGKNMYELSLTNLASVIREAQKELLAAQEEIDLAWQKAKFSFKKMPIEETTILTRGIEEILPLLEQLGKKASTVTSFEDAKALYELIRQVDWSHVQQVFDTTKLPDFQAESYTKGLQRAG